MVAILVLSSMLSIVCLYVFQQLVGASSRCRLPPGPRPFPIIGNLLDVASEHPSHRSLARLARRHGPLMTVRLGTRVTIVASSPSTAREVLQTHNGSLTGRSPPDAWRALGHASNSVFILPPRRKWRTLRRIGAEHLLSARLLDDGNRRLLPLLREAVLGLVRRVSCDGGATVEVGRVAFEAAMGLQWRVMFSAGLDDVETAGALHDAARETVALSFKPNLSDYFPALAAADLRGVRRRFGRQLAVVYRMIDEQIERREAADGGGRSSSVDRDLLDVLLDMSKQDHGLVTIGKDVIRAFLAVINYIFAYVFHPLCLY